MKQSLFSSMLSGTDGGISSKRSVMVWFVFLFTIVLLSNLFFGKVLQSELLNILFDLLLASMGAVFGEQFINNLGNKKTTSTQTVVAPADATVVNTTTTKEPETK